MPGFVAYVLLLAAVLLWGTYLVPAKKMESGIHYVQFLMCLGIFAFTLVSSLATGLPLTVSALGLASGAMWAAGNFLSLRAIEEIGISRAFPVWITSILIGYGWGVIFFSEMGGTGVLTGLLGTVMVLAGCLLITRTKNPSEGPLKKGIVFAALTAVLFGTYNVPFKLSGLLPGEFYFQVSVGVLLVGSIIFLSKREIPGKLELWKGFSGGAMWAMANLLGFYLIIFFGLAKTAPLTQTCVVVGTLWGIFYFREFRERSLITRILAGTGIILAGALLVVMA